MTHAFCEHFVTGQAHLMFIQGYVKVKVMSSSKLFQGAKESSILWTLA